MTEETDVKLWCGVYGEGSVFSVEIKRNADVKALQEAIGMADNDNLDDILSGQIDAAYKEMRPSWILDEDYFGKNFQPGRKEIHVLVALPPDQAGVTMLDRGWTAKWENEFRKNELAPHQRVYANRAAYDEENAQPLDPRSSLSKGSASGDDDRKEEMARKVWFQLVDAFTRGAFADTQTASVSPDGANDIEDIRNKIHAEYDHTNPPGRNLLAHKQAS
ncbi:hypothetical protein ATCC90586_006968 [Pythium insidiosum]|nr:hypothetical protein ATCC90586_006968 [Pythium insidiosum]